jgi:hypothetical protein
MNKKTVCSNQADSTEKYLYLRRLTNYLLGGNEYDSNTIDTDKPSASMHTGSKFTE